MNASTPTTAAPSEALTLPSGVVVPLTQSAAPPSAFTHRFVAQALGLTAAGLLVTGLAAWATSLLPAERQLVMFIPALIMQFALIFAMSSIRKVQGTTQLGFFIAFAIAEGVTFGLLASSVGGAKIALATVPAALTLLGMGAYGYFTRRNVLAWRPTLVVGLLSVLVMAVLNLFFPFGALDGLFALAGITLFAGFAAYDVRQLREQAHLGFQDENQRLNTLIHGATSLYLNMLNLTLFWLRFLGLPSKD